MFRRINFCIFKNYLEKMHYLHKFLIHSDFSLVQYLILIMLFDVCMYVNLYLNTGNHKLSLS